MAEANGRLVHLVDDDEAIRRSASFMLRTSGLTAQQHLADVVGQHSELLDVPPLRGLVVDAAGSPDVHPLHHADRIVVLGEAELWIPGVVGSVEQVVPVA